MESDTSELSGAGFEGELMEGFIDPLFQEAGITDTERKTAYCFGPGNGTELIALGKRFKMVRACESDEHFWKKSSSTVDSNYLANVTLLRADAIVDLEEEASKGASYDVVTMFGFGPPFALDARKIKQALLAANNILVDGSGKIIITSDAHTLKYLREQLDRIYVNQGEMDVITSDVDDIPVSTIALSKIAQTRVQESAFDPFSFLERQISKTEKLNKVPEKIIKLKH